jgi:DNA-binding MarR family transcriptional regulator
MLDDAGEASNPMTTDLEQPTPAIPDFAALAGASMETLLAELERAATAEPSADWGMLPALTDQLADFVMEESIRLIRLGTRVELADAAVALSEMMIAPVAGVLEERYPDAHAVLGAASIALAVAISPASKGGELAVLRSWNGNALEVLRRVSRCPGQSIPRKKLRHELELEESYLSHLLRDLEAASLIERIRDGKHVVVHLGPRGRAEHVQSLMDASKGSGSVVHAAVTRIRDEVALELPATAIEVAGLDDLRRRLMTIGDRAPYWEASITEVTASGDVADCHVRVRAAVWNGDRLVPFETTLLCSAHVAGDRVLAAELFVHEAHWRVLSSRPARDVGRTRVKPMSELLPGLDRQFAWTVPPDTHLYEESYIVMHQPVLSGISGWSQPSELEDTGDRPSLPGSHIVKVITRGADDLRMVVRTPDDFEQYMSPLRTLGERTN